MCLFFFFDNVPGRLAGFYTVFTLFSPFSAIFFFFFFTIEIPVRKPARLLATPRAGSGYGKMLIPQLEPKRTFQRGEHTPTTTHVRRRLTMTSRILRRRCVHRKEDHLQNGFLLHLLTKKTCAVWRHH